MNNKHHVYFAGNRALLIQGGQAYYLLVSADKKIETLCFFSQERAESVKKMEFKNSDLLQKKDWPRIFLNEVEEKVFPSAEDYRILLVQGKIRLIQGWTSDTLESIEAEGTRLDSYILQIQSWIDKGTVGNYLKFI